MVKPSIAVTVKSVLTWTPPDLAPSSDLRQAQLGAVATIVTSRALDDSSPN
jgi:hypothetical protein